MAFNQVIKSIKASVTHTEGELVKKTLQRFKMDMMKMLPFYGDILMRIDTREDRSIPTAQTNGKCIRYNPVFMAKLSEGQRNYVLLHEVLHVLLMHWKRDAGRDPLIWNVASDFVVNATLDRMKWQMQSYKIPFERPAAGCFYNGIYRGTPVEEFYAMLLKESREYEKKTGKKRVVLAGKIVGVRPEDLQGLESVDVTEMQMTEQQIKDLVRETVKRRGLGDSWMIPPQILSLVKTKKLPWHKLLYQYMESRADDDASYLTPERKYIHMDLIVPGTAKVEDELGEIWAFVDSSASIGGGEMMQFMTQLYRIAKEFSCTFNIAFWDTEVTDVYKKVHRKEQVLDCKPMHTGGTDINCVYKYIKDENIKPGVMIILTDGYYGNVLEPVGKLHGKTILVVTEGGRNIDDKNEIGRLARL